MMRNLVLSLATILFLAGCASSPALHTQVRNADDPARLQMLINAGENVNQRDSSTWSPLELAAYHGRLDSIEVLLAAGANIDARDGGGKTALYYAISGDEPEAARLLVDKGASIEVGNPPSDWPPAWLRDYYQQANGQRMADQAVAREASAQQAEARATQMELQALEQRIATQQERDMALPEQIRRDKYLVAFSNAMKEMQYTDAVFYANLLERTGMPVDDSLYYFWGDALLQLGQVDESLDKLGTYLRRAGNRGAYYTQTLSLMLQAESR